MRALLGVIAVSAIACAPGFDRTRVADSHSFGARVVAPPCKRIAFQADRPTSAAVDVLFRGSNTAPGWAFRDPRVRAVIARARCRPGPSSVRRVPATTSRACSAALLREPLRGGTAFIAVVRGNP